MMNKIDLTVKWQLEAAMLSRPVNLNALVAISKSQPQNFLQENTLIVMITILLNEKNSKKSNKDTKLDVLNILANVARGGKDCVDEVRSALNGVSEWFDEYMAEVEQKFSTSNLDKKVLEPELHKVMVLLLARCWNYQLKAEDVLELTRGDRKLALTTIVGLLEDGETFTTELRQRQKPGQGQLGQWEHFTVYERYEKALLLQICRLLRAFTHPATYFESNELTSFRVDEFSSEIDNLLQITLTSRFVEKLSNALFRCLFEKLHDHQHDLDNDNNNNNNIDLDDSDHEAVTCVQIFLQNLYFFASENTEDFHIHLLTESLLIPRLVLPYIHRCIRDITTKPDDVTKVSQHQIHDNLKLIKGLTAALQMLVIATFRASHHIEIIHYLHSNNPTTALLKTDNRRLCADNDYLYSLLCMLNVNLGSVCSYTSGDDKNEDVLLLELQHTYSNQMSCDAQIKVTRRLESSGALPLSRDSDCYRTLRRVLRQGEREERNDDEQVPACETKDCSEKIRGAEEKKVVESDDDDDEEVTEPTNCTTICNSRPKEAFHKKRASPSLHSLSPESKLIPKSPSHHTESLRAHSDIPKEFLCAINGHVMRHPVLVRPSGAHIERETIDFWIAEHGNICPVSLLPIEKDRDLVPATDLQNRIRRFHIQQTTQRQKSLEPEDDIYDF